MPRCFRVQLKKIEVNLKKFKRNENNSMECIQIKQINYNSKIFEKYKTMTLTSIAGFPEY